MIETLKKCLHCGEPMQTSRSTKKYCSDSCKQAAFYNRTAQPAITLNGIETLNDNDEDDENEAAIHNDNYEGSAEANQFVQDRQPFNVSLNVTKAVNNDNDIKETAKQSYSIPVSPKKPAPAQEDYEEDEQPFNVRNVGNRRETGEPFNVKRDIIPAVKQKPQNNEIEEEQYEWVRSELVDEIGDFLNDNYTITEMLQYPKKYWYSSDLEKVKWVSVRFRCIIENLLRLDNSIVERKTMITINKALKTMVEAWNFKFVPYNYPLKNEVKELQKSIEGLATSVDKVFRFGIGKEKKVKLIALRFQLADLVPFVKFNDLDFSK